MIYYSNIGLTKRIDFTKSKNSKGCIVCLYWYFNHGFKFQELVYNYCQDFLMISPHINNIVVIIVKGADYGSIIYGVSKCDTIHLLENSVLNDREFTLNATQRS